MSRALERISRRKAAAQICVLRGGEVILNHAFGCKENSLFWIFSASKPFMAVLIYLLAERGQVRLADGIGALIARLGDSLQHGESLSPNAKASNDSFICVAQRHS